MTWAGSHNSRRSNIQLAYLLGSSDVQLALPQTPYMVSTIIRTYFIKKPVRVQTVLSMKMPSSHHSSTTSMATVTTKKTRRLLKKEVMFISRRLQKLDLDIMEAFVVHRRWKQWNRT